MLSSYSTIILLRDFVSKRNLSKRKTIQMTKRLGRAIVSNGPKEKAMAREAR